MKLDVSVKFMFENSRLAKKLNREFENYWQKTNEGKLKSHSSVVNATIDQFVKLKKHQQDESKEEFTEDGFDGSPLEFLSDVNYMLKYIESYNAKAESYTQQYRSMDEKRCVVREQALYAS